jgi:hypothetical protein
MDKKPRSKLERTGEKVLNGSLPRDPDNREERDSGLLRKTSAGQPVEN